MFRWCEQGISLNSSRIKANSRSFLDIMEVSVYFDQKQISLSDIAGTG